MRITLLLNYITFMKDMLLFFFLLNIQGGTKQDINESEKNMLVEKEHCSYRPNICCLGI